MAFSVKNINQYLMGRLKTGSVQNHNTNQIRTRNLVKKIIERLSGVKWKENMLMLQSRKQKK